MADRSQGGPASRGHGIPTRVGRVPPDGHHGQDRRALQAPRADLPRLGDLRRASPTPTTTATTACCSKNNVVNAWWKAMIQERDDVVALDSAIIQHPRTWEASGHLEGFTDPLVDCKACKLRFRADHIEEARAGSAEHPDVRCGHAPSKLPGDHKDCDLTEAREFNLMFETTIGPVKEAGSTVYLRPETAQGIFLDFKTTLGYARKQAAVRDRPGRQVVPQRDHAGQLHLPHARVRADGDGVLRAAGPRPSAGTSTGWSSAWSGTCRSASTASSLRLRPHGRRRAVALLVGHERHRVPLSDRLVGARGDRQPRRLRPDPARRSTPARSSSTWTRPPASATCRT